MIENGHWTPAQCASIPLTVQWALWDAPPTGEEPDHFALANRRRELQGLPALTREEYEARQKTAVARIEAGKKDKRPLTPEEIARRIAEFEERQARG